MRNQMKLMAVLSAAAMMTVAAPMIGVSGGASIVYANENSWTQEDGKWHFYDTDGYMLTDTWKKVEDDWYYLDEDGEVALDTIVEEYYVGKDGKRVLNQWVSIDNEEEFDSPEIPERYWYYFGKDGKSITSKWQSIEGKWHYFNEEGHMLTGKTEVDGATYYLGGQDDGSMQYGWIQLEETSDDPEMSHSWYYFDKNGKMIENQVDKKIDNAYYSFEDGRLITGWYKLPVQETAETAAATPSDAAATETEESSIAGYQYYEKEGGKRASGWMTIEGAEGISEEDQSYNFYFKNGKPYYAEKGIELFTIDGKKYAFNTKGEMQTGLKVVNLADGGIANYYLAADGVMRTGKQLVYDENLGQDQNWYFHTDGSKKGQGFHGIRDNNVYIYGLRQSADADLRFAPVTLDETQYLVNAAGSIQKASTSSKSTEKPDLGKGFKDIVDDNGKTWVVDVNGIIQ